MKGSLWTWKVTGPDCNEMKNGKVGVEVVGGQFRNLEMRETQSLHSIHDVI